MYFFLSCFLYYLFVIILMICYNLRNISSVILFWMVLLMGLKVKVRLRLKVIKIMIVLNILMKKYYNNDFIFRCNKKN